MTIPNSKKVKTVERGTPTRGFPGNARVPRIGNQFPRQIGLTPKVIRGDALTPILPRGMVDPVPRDESVGGETMSFMGV